MAARPDVVVGDVVDLSQRLETASFRSLTTETKAHISETCNISSKRKRLDSAETLEFMTATNMTENGMREVRKLLRETTKFACEQKCRQFEDMLQVCRWPSGEIFEKIFGDILFRSWTNAIMCNYP